MKYLIMMTHALDESVQPVYEWTTEDVRASWTHM